MKPSSSNNRYTEPASPTGTSAVSGELKRAHRNHWLETYTHSQAYRSALLLLCTPCNRILFRPVGNSGVWETARACYSRLCPSLTDRMIGTTHFPSRWNVMTPLLKTGS